MKNCKDIIYPGVDGGVTEAIKAVEMELAGHGIKLKIIDRFLVNAPYQQINTYLVDDINMFHAVEALQDIAKAREVDYKEYGRRAGDPELVAMFKQNQHGTGDIYIRYLPCYATLILEVNV